MFVLDISVKTFLSFALFSKVTSTIKNTEAKSTQHIKNKTTHYAENCPMTDNFSWLLIILYIQYFLPRKGQALSKRS